MGFGCTRRRRELGATLGGARVMASSGGAGCTDGRIICFCKKVGLATLGAGGAIVWVRRRACLASRCCWRADTVVGALCGMGVAIGARVGATA